MSDEARPLLAGLRGSGKTIAQSNGIWDVIHPGHIYHLEEASELGDILVVSITADKFVRKGPGRPYFNEQLRLRSIAALECVNYVVLVPAPEAGPAIECVHPHIYCRGKEYEDPDFDISGIVKAEVEAVQQIGAQMRYIGSIKYSSTKLLNEY